MLNGEHLGPYDVLAKLGAGGMGEVYRARDNRLNREVAIKILPEALAADPLALARFERETQAVAALSHPNILSIHDVGVERGVPYAVMELLEGQTLRDQMSGGPIAPRKAIEYALQIAAGLGAAHARAITHRDLKPENVFVTRDGHVKILDFGLAKQCSAVPVEGTAVDTRHLETGPGMVLGTVGYMAPEQVRGHEVDPRADIFAFGAVLYELLAGRRAFQGATPADTASAVLSQDPPELATMTAVQVPPALDRIVRRCLEKNPDERFHSARDVAFALEAISGSGIATIQTLSSGARGSRPVLAWVACGVIVLGALAGLSWWRSAKPNAPAMYFSAPFPIAARDIAVAPNGHTVAVVGRRESARRDAIWLYELGSQDATKLANTEGATCPFWSPDGRFLAFFADGQLKKILVAGGPAQTLCDADSGRGGTWNKNGVIVFSPSGALQTGLYRIPDTGGVPPTKISSPDASRGEDSHRWPVFLPDGKHYLYLAATFGGGGDADSLFMGLLDSDEKRFVVKTPANAVYASPGYLIYYRDRTLFGQRFDPTSLALTGEPVAILTDVQYLSRIAKVALAVSEDGRLFAQKSSEASLSRLTWFDRKGNETGAVGAPDNYANVALARDGRFVAVDKTDNTNQNDDVWTYDTRGERAMRLTFDPGNDAEPVWSPDGARVVFSSNRRHQFDLYVKNTDGSQAEQLIAHGDADSSPSDWSRDGRFILYTGGRDLWILTFPELKSRRLVKAVSAVKGGQFSPDGKWVAYASNETGKWEIYVTDFPDAKGKWQVSVAGGEQPRWAGDGKEVFFLAPDDKIMAAPVKAGTSFDHGTPVALFQVTPRDTVATHEQANYDVDPTGQRFLVNTQVKKSESQPFSIVLNWDAALKR
ncbi:MAG: protein kinase [Acidobacteriota bacterium]